MTAGSPPDEEIRVPSRGRAVLAALAFAALPTGAVLLTTGWPVASVLRDGAGVAALLAVLAATGAGRRAWARTPWRHRALALAIAFGLTFGQIAQLKRKTFPFPSFNMYARSEAAAQPWSVRMTGWTADGAEVVVSPAALFRSLSHNRMANFVRNRAGAAELALREGGTAENAPALADLEEVTATVLAVYNRRHPDCPLDSVRVEHLRYPLRSVGSPADAAERRTLLVARAAP